MIGVEIIPTLHHVMAIAPLPKELSKKLEQDIYLVLGARVNKNGRPHWTKIPKKSLRQSRKFGGSLLVDVERKANSLLAMFWIQICEHLQDQTSGRPYW